MRDLRDISEETFLINQSPGNVSGICKSALFEMSLIRCVRRLKDAFEMHPCRLGMGVIQKVCTLREEGGRGTLKGYKSVVANSVVNFSPCISMIKQVSNLLTFFPGSSTHLLAGFKSMTCK